MNREDYEFVLELLRQGKVEAARDYLGDSNDPMAKQWLRQLTAKPVPASPNTATKIEPLKAPPKKIIKPLAKPVTKPVVTVAAISTAWQRDMEAMPDKSGLVGGAVLLVAVAGVLFLVSPMLMLVLGVLATMLMGFYATTAQEITSNVVETGLVERHYDWFSWVHYRVRSLPARAVQFPKSNLKIEQAPSAALVSVMRVHDVNASAGLLLRATLFALWGQGYLQVHEVRLERSIMGSTNLDTKPTYYLTAGRNLEQVKGSLERALVSKVAYWQRTYPQAIASHPWRQGPTPYELVASIMGAGGAESAQRLFEALRREMVEAKLFNPKTGTFADGLRDEGEAIMRALTVLGKEQRELDVAIQTQVLRAVRAKKR